MKLNKVLIVAAIVGFLPSIIFIVLELVNSYVLISSGICHQYNGNDFGSNPLCAIPTFLYFGGIILVFSGLGIFLTLLTSIALIATIIYFVRIAFHNWKFPNDKWRYSRFMIVVASYLIISKLVSLTGVVLGG